MRALGEARKKGTTSTTVFSVAILLVVSLGGCLETHAGGDPSGTGIDATPKDGSDGNVTDRDPTQRADHGDAADLDDCFQQAKNLERGEAVSLLLEPTSGTRRVNFTVDRPPRTEGVLSFAYGTRGGDEDPAVRSIAHYVVASFAGRVFVTKNPWPDDFDGRNRDVEFPFTVTLETGRDDILQIDVQSSAATPLYRLQTTGYRATGCSYYSTGSLSVDNATVGATSGELATHGPRIERAVDNGNRRFAVLHCAVRTGGPSSPLGEHLQVNFTTETGNVFGMRYAYGPDESPSQPVPYGFCFPAGGIRKQLESTLSYEPNGANATVWSLWMYSHTREPVDLS